MDLLPFTAISRRGISSSSSRRLARHHHPARATPMSGCKLSSSTAAQQRLSSCHQVARRAQAHFAHCRGTARALCAQGIASRSCRRHVRMTHAAQGHACVIRRLSTVVDGICSWKIIMEYLFRVFYRKPHFSRSGRLSKYSMQIFDIKFDKAGSKTCLLLHASHIPAVVTMPVPVRSMLLPLQ